MSEQYHQGQVLDEIGDFGIDASFELNLPLSLEGGFITLSFNGSTTADLDYPFDREQLRDALAAMPSINGVGNVEVIGSGVIFRIFMRGMLGQQPLPENVFPFTADGTALEPPVNDLRVLQVEKGRSRQMLTDWAANWANFASTSDENLRALLCKRALLKKLIGEAQKFVKTVTNDKEENPNQQFDHLVKLLAICEADIQGITGPGGSGVSPNTNSGIVTGRIAKRTPSGVQLPESMTPIAYRGYR